MMLTKAIALLKSRWPETLLVVATGAGLTLLFQQVIADHLSTSPQTGQIPGWAIFVLGVGCALMGVVWQMLYLGFLRTAATDGAMPHEPLALLTTGRPFFWRFLWMQMLLGALLWIVHGLLSGTAAALLGYQDLNTAPLWLMHAAGVGAIAVLLKPVFLIPAFMLALDLSAMEAFGMMRQTRLDELGGLVKHYAAGLAAIAAVSIAASVLSPHTPGFYIAAAAADVVHNAVMLTLTLATILWITGQTAQVAAEE